MIFHRWALQCPTHTKLAGFNVMRGDVRVNEMSVWREGAMWMVLYVTTIAMVGLAFVPLPALDE